MNVSLHVFYASILSVEIWCQCWCIEQNFWFMRTETPFNNISAILPPVGKSMCVCVCKSLSRV